jgi:hypothetical protein
MNSKDPKFQTRQNFTKLRLASKNLSTDGGNASAEISSRASTLEGPEAQDPSWKTTFREQK